MADNVRPTCWINKKEWIRVYDLIFHSDNFERKIEGLKMIDVWKSRSEAKLPVAVDCTACLVSATVVGLARATSGDTRDELLRRLALAMALVRFVNGMVDQAQKGVYARSVQTIAEEIGIPDWLVDLRHDATHSSLPSLEILEDGCTIALRWLQSHYWERTCQSFKESKPLDAKDEFNDFLHQYLSEYWPLKRPDKELLDSLCEKIKGMMSVDAMRCSVIPSLVQSGILLPSQIQVEELEDRGFKEPIKELIEFWKPLIIRLQERNSQFIALLTDSLLEHFEDQNNSYESRRFVTQLISTFVMEFSQLDCENRDLSYRIFRYCLLDPSRESNHLFLTVKNLANLGKSEEIEIKALYDAVMPQEDIFSKCSLVGDLQSSKRNFRLQEYFSAMPVAGLNLSCLIPDLARPQRSTIASWSVAAGISWSSVQEGLSLHCFESLQDSSTNVLQLPQNVDAAVSEAIRLSNDLDSDSDIPFSRVFSESVEENDVRFDDEELTVNPTCRQPSYNEMHPSVDVCLF